MPSDRSRWMWTRRHVGGRSRACSRSAPLRGSGRDVQPDFRLTPANGPTVTAICQRLDALPLALELAAPWIKVLTAEDLLRRLQTSPALDRRPARSPERQQTMNATVAWSYQLLTPTEQRVFRRLGALPGLFPIDAAASVLAGRADIPAAMDEASARRRPDGQEPSRASQGSVPTHPFTRCWKPSGRTRCSSSPPRASGTMPWRASCAMPAEAALAAEGLVGPAQVEWLDRVRDDLESYRGALTWLIEHRRPVEAWTSRGDCSSSGSSAGMLPKACGGMTRSWAGRLFRPLPNARPPRQPR